MKSVMPVVSILGLVGAGVVVTWSVMSRPTNSSITQETVDSFNLQTSPVPSRKPGEPLHDAVTAAQSSLTRPIAGAGMASVGAPKAAAEKRYTIITPKAEAWALKHVFLAGLMAKPAAFLMSRSSLGSARGLRAFLGDPKKVDAYLNSALVRITLNSPAVAKTLLGNPAVIGAFLATPALGDPQTVRALFASPMLRKMLDCPAIKEAMDDPVVMRKMLADPQTVSWIATHPDALTAIVSAAPALGDALTAKTR